MEICCKFLVSQQMAALHLQIQAVMWKYSVFERYSNQCIKLDILVLVDQYLFQYVQISHELWNKAF
jgi:hypothetical protein